MASRKKTEKITNVVQGKWTSKQLKAILFLANPMGGTQRQLAAELKIDEARISEWKKLNGFMEDVHRVALTYFLEADLIVDRACFKAAVEGDIKAMELYYKRRGLLNESGKPAGSKEDPQHMVISWQETNYPPFPVPGLENEGDNDAAVEET